MGLTSKYRPQKLAEIVGHQQIVTYFKNAIIKDALHPAYLFTGVRGTGKTSLSRVLAKSLNCKDSSTVDPCGVCSNCRHIQSSDALGVFEIDCATNNGVDYARQLAENASIFGLLKFTYRYKIYILDEAHNLTKQAFDALLKTIEEPGKKTLFILVTTELSKVPDTIKSRCQIFTFAPIDLNIVLNHINYILNQEGIELAPDIINAIVEEGQGILRETLTLLDKVLLSEISTLSQFQNLLSKPSTSSLINMMEAIANQNYAEIYRELKILNKNSEPMQVLKDLANFVRNAIVSHNNLDYRLMSCDTQTFKTANSWGKKYPIHTLINAQIILRDSEAIFPKSAYSHLESTLLKLSLVFKPVINQTTSTSNPWYNKTSLSIPIPGDWGDLCQQPLLVKLRSHILDYLWTDDFLQLTISEEYNQPTIISNIEKLLYKSLLGANKKPVPLKFLFVST